jgi:tetratricopeptide (TPR) repeat protein
VAQVFGGVTATGGGTAIGNVAGTVHVHPATTPPIPRQLPAPPTGFVGRTDQLAHLDRTLTSTSTVADSPPPNMGINPHEGMGAAVFISALGGAGGIGKTWLALQWAHRNSHRFPDGQLFVDLRGFSPDSNPLDPSSAIRGFLVAFGIGPGRIPADPDAQAALYRSTIADKHMLIVLDNAAATDQVEPLLPGTATCTVLITGRKKLATLITRYGARHLQLDILSHDEAHALLTKRLGHARVTAEPHAADDLIQLCGRYPLALAITTRHAHTHPHIPLAEFATELRELGLDALDNDDPAASLPTVLSWSLHQLTTEQRTVFALLGIAPGPDIGLPAAASLTGIPRRHTSKIMTTLEDASLLTRQPGGRYAMHDLVRDYATTTATHHIADELRDAALRRVLDFYVHTAYSADHLLDPNRSPIKLALAQPTPQPGTQPLPLPDDQAAMAWFDSEHANLLAAQHTATMHAWHHTVWNLAWTLNTFQYRRGHLHDQVTVWHTALDAAAHLPDPTTGIRAHRLLGLACADVGRHEEAIDHLHQALSLAEHDLPHQAVTHLMLARTWEQRGDDKRALDHSSRALDIYRDLNQPVWEAHSLNAVGWYAARLGDFDTARTHCQAALTLHQHHHDPDGEATAWDSLGYVAHHTGHHHRAIDNYNRALILRRNLAHTPRTADTLAALGHPHAALGHYHDVRAVWQEALQLYQEQGRDHDVERVQQQLDALDHPGSDQPSEPPKSVT